MLTLHFEPADCSHQTTRVAEQDGPAPPRSQTPTSRAPLAGDGFLEEPVRFGPGRCLFGVLCRPAAPGGGGSDGGLDFPSTKRPDYWDFFYFSAVLGMTFQVSDVQITSRKLRRLATAHGMLGFLFNTVVVALTVNLASGLLS